MKTIRIPVTAALIAIVAGAFAAHPRGAFASTGLHVGRHSLITAPETGPAYDIEAVNYYCTGGGTACATNAGLTPYTFPPIEDYCGYDGNACPGLNFAKAESFGPYDGSTYGTPVEVEVECRTYTANGYQEISGTVHSAADMWYQNGALGAIAGKSTVFGDPSDPMTGSESNTAQVSSQNFSAYSPNVNPGVNEPYPNSFRASVAGTQNTDNEDFFNPPFFGDSLNSGATRITLTGYIASYDNFGVYQAPTHYGTLSCVAGGPNAYDLVNGGFSINSGTFEGEMEGGNL